MIDLLADKGVAQFDDLSASRPITPGRFSEIGRVLEGMQIAHREGDKLISDPKLDEFVGYWEEANLEQINACFSRYQPYKRFLNFLKIEGFIPLPPKKDVQARRLVGGELRSKKGPTFVAVDTFRWWGMSVGQVYMSHIGDSNVYWGGERPALDSFEKCLVQFYSRTKPVDSFANIGRLADSVCRGLKISFIEFEKLFEQLCLQKPDYYLTSTSLAREPTTTSPVQTLLPRTQAKFGEGNYRLGRIEWTSKRYMEDGVFIGKRNVKMISIKMET